MAFETITTAYTGPYLVDSSDIVTLLPDVVLHSSTDGFLSRISSLADARLNILGTVVTAGDGIDFQTGVTIGAFNSVSVHIGADAQILADGYGMQATRGNTPSQVYNHGLIASHHDAIRLLGYEGGRIENHGTITSEGGSAIAAANYIEGSGHYDIVNTGTLSGTGTDADFATLRVSEASIINSGTIIASGGPYAVHAADTSTLNNSGVIHGGVYSHTTANFVVRNSGTIAGDVTFGGAIGTFNVYFAEGDATVENIVGGEGHDSMYGAAADDTFFGGANGDLGIGRGGHDILVGEDGDDTLRGGAGEDELYGGNDSDEMHGGSGNDFISGDDGGDDIRGDSGDDTIEGGNGEDTIDGGSGEENISGGVNADTIYGRSGDDFIRGDSGGDSIGGGAGDDTISGGTGHDSIDGGSGDDRIFGGANDDTLEGTTGNDYLSASSGDDVLSGGSDNDTLIGGSGTDTLSGGNGADVFIFSDVSDSPHGTTRDILTDFETGIDTLDLSGFSGTLTFVGAYYTGAGNEVRYNDAVGRLYIDVDGDSASDFSVDLGAGAGLTAGDLIL